MATKAQEVYDAVEAMIAAGTEKRDVFKQLAEQYGQPVDSIRGAYYGWKKQLEGGKPSRSRKRETTPADAVEQAVATLRRSIEAIDREIEAAEGRAAEATAEAKALKESATARKREIEGKIKALEA
jgi:predicted  nucleic acid-binding Zn-ribbon protein